MKFEDIMRIHVQNLHRKGNLAWRENDLRSRLERLEDTVKLMQNYGVGSSHHEILEIIHDLKTINEAFELATVEYTNFYALSDSIERAIAQEIQDLYEDYPDLEKPVSLMRYYELSLKRN